MRPIPTRRLALVAALASVLVLALPGGGWVPLLIVDGVLLLVAVADFAFAVDPRRMDVARDLPAVVALGNEGRIAWTVRNPTRRSVRVGVADDLAPSLRATTRRAWGRVPAGGTMTASATLRPTRRGRFDLAHLVVRVDGTLGLVARQRTIERPAVLRIHPPFRSRDEAELRINRARILEVGLRSARGRGGGTEFDQLREYSVDDEVRRIDWASTARSGKAMVRTYRAERNQNVLVLLDNGRTMAGRVAEVPRLEHAMDAVLCLTTVATHLGDRCGLVVFDRDVRAVVPARSNRDQVGRVAEAMYDLEPALVESDYSGAFTQSLARFRRRSLIVLLTELAEQAVAEWLLPAMPLISRHHVVIVASVQDPDVAAWASEPPADGPDAYRAAAAVTALEERARATARLQALGATVVDSPPGRLAPRLADAYLNMKAIGRL